MMIRRRKPDHTLAKVVVVIVLLALAGGGIYKLVGWLGSSRLAGTASVAAMESYAQAEQAYTNGDYAGAKKILGPLSAKADMPRAAILLARVEAASGKSAEALAVLEKAVELHKNKPSYAEVAVAYAAALERDGNTAQALAVYHEVSNIAPPELRAPATTGLGREAERQNDLLRARDLYRQSMQEAQYDSPAWLEAVGALGRSNVALIFSPMSTPESQKYSVKRGDSITSIGNALNTTQGLLTRANSITETTTLHLGQNLKYTPKDFRIIIERSTCRLYLMDKDGLFKLYSVGLGKPGHETALGSYKIGNKEKDPIWHKPGEGPIPPGDPRNQLGTRWMPLVPDQEGLPTDLGIHGTIQPETVGFYTSNGCARLLNDQVEELYDLVVRATPVDIVENIDKNLLGKRA